MSEEPTVQFGFERVSAGEKTRRVAGVFRSVAQRYDLMNDLMSLGSHRLMKRMTIEMSGVRAGHTVVDLAGGTGDFATLYAPLVQPGGRVVLADINAAMLEVGRDRLLDRGITNVDYCLADAEALPFDDESVNSAAGLPRQCLCHHIGRNDRQKSGTFKLGTRLRKKFRGIEKLQFVRTSRSSHDVKLQFDSFPLSQPVEESRNRPWNPCTYQNKPHTREHGSK